MYRLNRILLVIVLLLHVCGTALAASPELEQGGPETNLPQAQGLALRFERGLLSAYINHVPLGKVLRELSKQISISYHLYDPGIANQPIVASVKPLPFDDAIKRILAGFSHVLQRAGATDTPRILVLSASTTPVTATKSTADALHEKAAIAPSSAYYSNPAPADAGAPPRSLDEYEPLATDEDSSEKEHQEARLRRAVGAIQSGHPHLQQEALAELADIQDPTATQTLVEMAEGAEAASKTRMQAVEALWLHAANGNYTDDASLQALQRLSEDIDSKVSELALTALNDIQHYQNANK